MSRAPEIISGATAGSVLSAGMANQLWPAVIHPLPDVAYQARLTTENGVNVQWGTIGVHAPHALGNFPAGVHASFTQLPIYLTGPHNVFKTVAEVTHHVPGLADQTALTLAEHLAAGSAVGAALGGWAVLAAGRALERHSIRERFQDIRALPRLKRLGAVAIATASMAALSGCGKIESANIIPSDQGPSAPLTAAITNGVKELRGAYETGIGRQDFIKAERNYTDVSNALSGGPPNETIQSAIHNVETAYQKAEESAPLKQLESNPNIITMQVASDIHCYYPNYPLVQSIWAMIGPQIIVDNGDIQTSAGRSPLESSCIQDEIKAMRAAASANKMVIHALRINGNHDAKNTITVTTSDLKLVTLRNPNKPFKIMGLSFLGADDPRTTVYSTTPAGPAATKALILEGSRIAKAACSLKPKDRPIIITHDSLASQEALYKGCTVLALNGHTHHNGKVRMIYGYNGQIEYQKTVGTATGVSEGLLPIQQPVFKPRDCTENTWFINKRTHEPVAELTEDVHPNSTAEVYFQPLTADPETLGLPTLDLIKRYSPTAREWLAAPTIPNALRPR